MKAFDKNKAFTPKTEKEIKQRMAEISEAGQKIRQESAELIKDERFTALKGRIYLLRNMVFETLLLIDMNNPLRFSLQAEAKVVDDWIKNIENSVN